jgi:tryptophan-rich sensory protein
MKTSQILVIITTITVIVVNYLASQAYIGGITPNYISDKYPTFLTPAGYAFMIWAWIYLGVILFTIYQAMPNQIDKFTKVRGFYLLSCLANCVWIFLWHQQLTILSIGAMLVLLVSLIAININLSKEDSLIARVPFGMYFGWITAATVVCIAVSFASIGYEFSATFASIVILLVSIIAVLVNLKLKNAAYGLAIAWAITAIAVKHGGVTIISFASGIAVITLLISVITPFLRLEEAKR